MEQVLSAGADITTRKCLTDVRDVYMRGKLGLDRDYKATRLRSVKNILLCVVLMIICFGCTEDQGGSESPQASSRSAISGVWHLSCERTSEGFTVFEPMGIIIVNEEKGVVTTTLVTLGRIIPFIGLITDGGNLEIEARDQTRLLDEEEMLWATLRFDSGVGTDSMSGRSNVYVVTKAGEKEFPRRSSSFDITAQRTSTRPDFSDYLLVNDLGLSSSTHNNRYDQLAESKDHGTISWAWALLLALVPPLMVHILTRRTEERKYKRQLKDEENRITLKLQEEHRKLAFSGMLVFEQLLEEAKAAEAWYRQLPEHIAQNHIPATIPSTVSWSGINTISDDVMFLLGDATKPDPYIGFEPIEVRSHTKNLFKSMHSQRVGMIEEASRRREAGAPNWADPLKSIVGHADPVHQVVETLELCRSHLRTKALI